METEKTPFSRPPNPDPNLLKTKLDYLKALEEKKSLQEGLPHLYGWPWYKWAREYFESVNPFCFIVAANQISKSSSQIRKCIDWATDKKRWALLWRREPTQFWYFYPSKDVATIEFETKWVREFLPRGEYKTHPIYGWKEDWDGKYIHAVHFNSGVSVYFKSYEMNVQNLQASTVYAMFCDEELPWEIYNELIFRVQAVDGYFSCVFTATIGQDVWRRTMEPNNKDEELFKGAFKRQVSMWDCLTYEDGTASPWTPEKIRRVEASCATENERLRRVDGRFVVSGGLKYASFAKSRNVSRGGTLPGSWLIYSGVDMGSGGEKGHPAAITFVAVSPDYKRGRIFRGWRGDGIDTTTQDILAKHTELKTVGFDKKGQPIVLRMAGQYYDWQSRDFFLVATRAGEAFQPADKGRDRGEQILNTLFKAGMLSVDEEDIELGKLVTELTSLLSDTPKTKAKDDFCDSLRYAVSQIPWDWSAIVSESLEQEEGLPVDARSPMEVEIDERRAGFMKKDGPSEYDAQYALDELEDQLNV